MPLSRPVHRFVSLSVFLALLLSACNPIAATIPPPQAESVFVCPVTQAPTPPYTPPAPYPNPPEGYFWHGSDALWTGLPDDGVWWGLPHNDDGYGQKFFAWRVGYDPTIEPEPALTVTPGGPRPCHPRLRARHPFRNAHRHHLSHGWLLGSDRTLHSRQRRQRNADICSDYRRIAIPNQSTNQPVGWLIG